MSTETTKTDTPITRNTHLRSARWFEPDDLRSFGHRSRIKQLGYSEQDFLGKPIIAILNTYSDLNSCHGHFPQRVEEIKRGVFQAGGFPVELPAISLDESFQKPTTMLYRNLLSLETEELLRSHPIDGAVLMGGCDKTTPGTIMGVLSADIPSIFFPAGPMMSGCWQGNVLGSGSDAWKFWDDLRAGNISECDWKGIEGGIARTHGHCMTMGTASTMTAIAETLGFTLPGASSIPAVSADHSRMAAETGRMSVEIVLEQRSPSKIMSESSIHNAVTVALALGGSTNAVVHVVAIARRAGLDIGIDFFDKLADQVPLLANIRPAGDYLMQDFYDAGGIRGLIHQLEPLLKQGLTVNGKLLLEPGDGNEVYNSDVIRSVEDPVTKRPALRVLYGNICPDGALIKPSSMDPSKKKHVGPALVFDSYRSLKAQIDDPDLDVDANTVLVMRGAGPVGGPGMPEWGMMPLPKKLLEIGVRDLVRISDARMSGTSYGTCVLHVAPEAAVGGPLAALETGDLVELDVDARSLNALVSRVEWAERLANVQAKSYRNDRGWTKLYRDHVNQANAGCDFDFLAGSDTNEPEIL